MGTCASNYFVDEINRMKPPNIAAMSLVQFPGGAGESTNTQYLKLALSILVSLLKKQYLIEIVNKKKVGTQYMVLCFSIFLAFF